MAGVKLNDKINYLPHAHTLTHTHIGGLETSIDFIKRVSACGRACALMTLFSQLLSLQDVVLTPNPRLLSQPQDADARSLIWRITMAGYLCVCGKWDLVYGLTLIYGILNSTWSAIYPSTLFFFI